MKKVIFRNTTKKYDTLVKDIPDSGKSTKSFKI